MNIFNSSPLRYPGSKRKILPFLQKAIDQNRIKANVLVEPFVGGGSVFLFFLRNRLVDKVIIADKDRMIYSLWHTIFFESEKLKYFIKNTKVNLKTFNKYKNIAKNQKKYSKLVLAKACLFLNRTSFSGILRNEVGPIGGKSQKGEYRIDCRFNIKGLIEKIDLVKNFRKKITVLPSDWEKTIDYAKKWSKKNRKGRKLIFYFDPPFYRKADKLYRHFFEKKDHEALCKKIMSLKEPWFLSYDNVEPIKEMYKKVKKRKAHIEMPYSVNSHAVKITKELIISRMKLPNKKTLEKIRN